MKKIYLPLILAALIMLSGCGQKQTATNPTPDPGQNTEQDNHSLACSYLCELKIPDLCADYMAEQTEQGFNFENTIFEDATCQLMCEAEWDETTIGCMSFADECAQISNDAPHCIDDDTEGDTAADPNMPGACAKACNNYTKCVSYGEDITPQDINDAFDSCMQICSTWDKSARDCVTNTAIKSPGDCAAQTACLLPAVKNLMNGQ